MHLKTSLMISIDANIEKIWEVLTQAKFTKVYMFNCAVESSWKKGDSITWKGNFEGYEAFQKGSILEIENHKLIKYSTFDPNYGLEDIPDNYIHVTYKLSQKNEVTQLQIINETFDGKTERMEHIQQGWEMLAPKIKEVAEME